MTKKHQLAPVWCYPMFSSSMAITTVKKRNRMMPLTN